MTNTSAIKKERYMTNTSYRLLAAATVISIALLLPSRLGAHCDTMAGPVIADAKVALKTGDVTPVLKWLKPDHEAEIRAVFLRTMKVRAQSSEARELADDYFFETLVRLHRAGEGAPYTGLKPAEAAEPITIETDKALETESVDGLLKALDQDLVRGIRQRFARALEARKHAGDSVAAGRKYVEAYIELTHYIETVHTVASGRGSPHGAEVASDRRD